MRHPTTRLILTVTVGATLVVGALACTADTSLDDLLDTVRARARHFALHAAASKLRVF